MTGALDEITIAIVIGIVAAAVVAVVYQSRELR